MNIFKDKEIMEDLSERARGYARHFHNKYHVHENRGRYGDIDDTIQESWLNALKFSKNNPKYANRNLYIGARRCVAKTCRKALIEGSLFTRAGDYNRDKGVYNDDRLVDTRDEVDFILRKAKLTPLQEEVYRRVRGKDSPNVRWLKSLANATKQYFKYYKGHKPK